ncbi:hypothetical protein LTV02_26265 [Nocardia yamanashiensis]|uniref:hypothetical protein n=1 Tax=Nocardia yamanashiensis TaxID=209247 RepID=UPI001E5A80AF|nr:hypothetical protein [Nocardia yamanashiensis]UGT39552.1 hypothetical protein LTV02_26265 [Nocardia yamanashiensis]
MTMTTAPTVADRDLRPRAAALIAGGVLFAIGNGLHPLEHSETAEHAPTWVAAHLTFSAGAVLMAVGLPLVTAAWRFAGKHSSPTASETFGVEQHGPHADSPVGMRAHTGVLPAPADVRPASDRPGTGWVARVSTLAGALLYVGLTLAIPVGAYHEAFVAPRLSHHEQTAIEDAALPVNGPLAAAFLLGFLLLAACALAAPRPLLGRPAAAVIILAVFAMAAAEALPGAEGFWIIPGTIAVGLVLAASGVRALRN